MKKYKMQQGGIPADATRTTKPISKLQIDKNKKEAIQRNWLAQQTTLQVDKPISPAQRAVFKQKEGKEYIDNLQDNISKVALGVSPIPVVGQVFGSGASIANGAIDLLQGDYGNVALDAGLSVVPYGIGKYKTVKQAVQQRNQVQDVVENLPHLPPVDYDWRQGFRITDTSPVTNTPLRNYSDESIYYPYVDENKVSSLLNTASSPKERDQYRDFLHHLNNAILYEGVSRNEVPDVIQEFRNLSHIQRTETLQRATNEVAQLRNRYYNRGRSSSSPVQNTPRPPSKPFEELLDEVNLDKKDKDVFKSAGKPKYTTGTIEFTNTDDPIVHKLVDNSFVQTPDNGIETIESLRRTVDVLKNNPSHPLYKEAIKALEDAESTHWLQTDFINELKERGKNPTLNNLRIVTGNGRTKYLVNEQGEIMGNITGSTPERPYVGTTGLAKQYHGDTEVGQENKLGEALYRGISKGYDNVHGIKLKSSGNFATTSLVNPQTGEVETRKRAMDFWNGLIKKGYAKYENGEYQIIKALPPALMGSYELYKNIESKQSGGYSSTPVAVERGEIMRDMNGNLQEVGDTAPSHDDNLLSTPQGNYSVPSGKGGVVLGGIESVLSDSQTQINSGKRANNSKDAIIKIKPSEAKGIGKELGLTIKPSKSVSPSELFRQLQKARDKKSEKLLKALDNERDDNITQNSKSVVAAQVSTLPSDDELYELAFSIQESAKEGQPEFAEEETMQYGGLSITGYRNDSPDRFNDFNIIPSNRISMKNVNKPLLLMGDGGEVIQALPGEEYVLPYSENVLEVPYAQAGGGDFSKFYNKSRHLGLTDTELRSWYNYLQNKKLGYNASLSKPSNSIKRERFILDNEAMLENLYGSSTPATNMSQNTSNSNNQTRQVDLQKAKRRLAAKGYKPIPRTIIPTDKSEAIARELNNSYKQQETFRNIYNSTDEIINNSFNESSHRLKQHVDNLGRQANAKVNAGSGNNISKPKQNVRFRLVYPENSTAGKAPGWNRNPVTGTFEYGTGVELVPTKPTQSIVQKPGIKLPSAGNLMSNLLGAATAYGVYKTGEAFNNWNTAPEGSMLLADGTVLNPEEAKAYEEQRWRQELLDERNKRLLKGGIPNRTTISPENARLVLGTSKSKYSLPSELPRVSISDEPGNPLTGGEIPTKGSKGKGNARYKPTIKKATVPQGTGTPLYDGKGKLIGHVPTEVAPTQGIYNIPHLRTPGIVQGELNLPTIPDAKTVLDQLAPTEEKAVINAPEDKTDPFAPKWYDVLPDLMNIADSYNQAPVLHQQVRNPQISLQRYNPGAQVQATRESFLSSRDLVNDPGSSVGQAMILGLNKNYTTNLDQILANAQQQNLQFANQELLQNAQYQMDEDRMNNQYDKQAYNEQLQMEDNARVQRDVSTKNLAKLFGERNAAKAKMKLIDDVFGENFDFQNGTVVRNGNEVTFAPGISTYPANSDNARRTQKTKTDKDGNVSTETSITQDEYNTWERVNRLMKRQHGGKAKSKYSMRKC